MSRRHRAARGAGARQHRLSAAIRLSDASGDAEALAGVLKSVGLDVVLGTNLSRDAMAEKLSQFAGLAGGSDVALFFYAGHGIQLDGKNLLIPVDADLKSELDAKVRMLEIDSILQHTMADAKVKIVPLDACRDNPFARQIRDAAPRRAASRSGRGWPRCGRERDADRVRHRTGPSRARRGGQTQPVHPRAAGPPGHARRRDPPRADARAQVVGRLCRAQLSRAGPDQRQHQRRHQDRQPRLSPRRPAREAAATATRPTPISWRRSTSWHPVARCRWRSTPPSRKSSSAGQSRASATTGSSSEALWAGR